MAETKIKCGECKCLISTGDEDTDRLPCPECGSRSLLIVMTIDEDSALMMHDSVKGKLTRPALRSKDKLRSDIFAGQDQSRSSGKWYVKERIIDRDKDYYMEKLTDADTGEVIHFCEEKLSEHRDRGSAKAKG
jgi:DNA-directed RNA polymerase subunit RPC12/RpoP